MHNFWQYSFTQAQRENLLKKLLRKSSINSAPSKVWVDPVFIDSVRRTDPDSYKQIIDLLTQYREAMTQTWKINGYLRLNMDIEHSDKLEDLVNFKGRL